MREIKFRLRIDNRVVGYEKWYSGDKKFFMVDTPCWLYSEDGKRWSPMYILHNQKDQFVDFLTKNEKEIYEGDILKGNYIVRFGYREDVFDGFVLLGDGDEDNKYATVCGVYLEDDYGHYKTLSDYLGDYNLEIIGNIYENPELLGKV